GRRVSSCRGDRDVDAGGAGAGMAVNVALDAAWRPSTTLAATIADNVPLEGWTAPSVTLAANGPRRRAARTGRSDGALAIERLHGPTRALATSHSPPAGGRRGL
ncbi:MAG TPA: hypothetical protein VGF91_31150, partial [Solirubrobacteraceae bacterium]